MISSGDIAEALAGLGLKSPSAVMVHSSLRACLRVAGTTPTEKMQTVIGGLSDAVGNGVLAMPTFTYSFCESEPFNLERSPSTVGVLTEYFRGLPDVRRTTDPLFSTAIRGRVPPQWEDRLFEVSDVDCFGPHSVFSYLHEVNASFVFFGVGLEACTFIHHVEQSHGVRYRYHKDFHGIVEAGGRRTAVNASYFVRPLDGTVEVFLAPLEAALLESGGARTIRLTRGPQLLVTDARSIENVAVARMRDNPEFLLRRGHQGPPPRRQSTPAIPLSGND